MTPSILARRFAFLRDCLVCLLCCVVGVRGRDVELTELPGLGQNILFVAQAVFYGLANAVDRHSSSWKHPNGETVVLTAQAVVVSASIAQIALIHTAPVLQLTGDWLLALYLGLPLPLLVPVTCFITHRVFGLNRRSTMRPAVAKWETMQGNIIPYWQLNQNIVGAIINLVSFAGTFYSLWVLARREGGTMYPLFSAVVVLLLSGVLGAIPPLKKAPCNTPKGNTIPGDQLLLPVLGASDETSVIVIWMPARSSNLHIARFSTNLEYTPFKRSEYKDAFEKLFAIPPGANDTAAFADDFKKAFEVVAGMFAHECQAQAQQISFKFARALYERKYTILDNLQVFDGNSSMMRALAMVVFNMMLNKAQERGINNRQPRGSSKAADRQISVERQSYPLLTSVAELFAWAYGRNSDEFPPLAKATTPQGTPVPSPRLDYPRRGHQDAVVEESVQYQIVEGDMGPPGVVLKDRQGRAYDIGELNEMVQQLGAQERHEVMVFLLLMKMAKNNDTRLGQEDTIAGGRDVTLTVTENKEVITKPWPGGELDPVERKEPFASRWEERRKKSGFDCLKDDPLYEASKPDDGTAFAQVSPQNVPVAWNAFWIVQQNLLSWMLSYMAMTIVVILIDTFLRGTSLDTLVK